MDAKRNDYQPIKEVFLTMMNEKGFNVINDDTEFKFKSDQWCIGCTDPTKDILGKAVIIHQGTDDYKSQPSGAAGSRVSCGGIIE